jgi:hypothetical protein
MQEQPNYFRLAHYYRPIMGKPEVAIAESADSVGEGGSQGRAKNLTQIRRLQSPKFNRLRDGSWPS